MSAPVWLLSVDLQTKTASFTTGLADAARSARGSFNDIGMGAEQMGERGERSFGNLRANLGLIDNTIRGAHAQAMADLMRLWAQNAIVMSALPIAATAAGFLLVGGIVFELANKLHQLKLAQEKLTNDMMDFETAGNKAYLALEDRLTEAGERADELHNDHLGALNKQLDIIDHQSMSELVKSLEEVGRATDSVFKDLTSHWYTFWEGSSAGAKKSLDDFQTRYNNLLSTGNDQDASKASDMLHAKLAREMQILEYQKTLANTTGGDTDESWAARVALQRLGASYSEKDIPAQQALVHVLQQQAEIEAVINKLKTKDQGNARTQEGNEEAQRRAAAARESAQSQLQMGTSSMAAQKATADAALTIHRATLEDRLSLDLAFAKEEQDIKLAANQAELAALDKSGKDYANQVKANEDQALSIKQEYATKTATLTATESVAAYNRDLTALQQSEREKIDATREGSAARLSVLNAAIQDEQSRELQNTDFYRGLLTERVQLVRQMGQDAAKDAETAGLARAANAEKMGELSVAAEKQHIALLESTRRISMQTQIDEETQFVDELYKIKLKALQQDAAALDTSGKDYENRLKQLQDRETQLTQAHENELTAIKEKAEIQRNQRVLAANDQFNSAVSAGLTKSIMGHQTWSQMVISLGDQVVSGVIRNAIMSMMADDMTKEKDAAYAARQGFNAGLKFPFPANIVMAPVLAASMFAQVMAFSKGTESVPGAGRGDTVPAMLTPGEGVVPGGVMDGLRSVARNGGFQQQGHTVHVHGVTYAPTVHALDKDGVDEVLSKHGETFQKHFDAVMRRANY